MYINIFNSAIELLVEIGYRGMYCDLYIKDVSIITIDTDYLTLAISVLVILAILNYKKIINYMGDLYASFD